MIVYLLILLSLFKVETVAGKPARFKVKLMTVSRCKLPESKWSPARPPLAHFTINKLDRDTAVVECNFTVEKPSGPIFMTYRTYQVQQNSAMNLVFKLERVSCTNPMTFKLIQMMNVNITKDCLIQPGHYHYKNLNLDKLAWMLTKSLTTPGKYAFEVEFNEPRGVLSCYDLICDLIERKQ